MKRTVVSIIFSITLLILSSQTSHGQKFNLKGLTNLLPLFIKDDQIGLMFSEGLEKKYGLSTDQLAIARVENVGRKITSCLKTKTKYDFAVLASNQFNASSMYGGHIRIFQGLLSDTRNSDAELSVILAHEIAHNELGHNKEAVKSFRITYAAELVHLTDKMPALLSAAANAVLAKRSREFEKEADLQALKWLEQAGQKVTGAIAVYRRIEAERRKELANSNKNLVDQRFAQIFATHPEPQSRVTMAEDFLFTQKYGQTFKKVLGASETNLSIAGNCPIIVAHPSQWKSPLRITSSITGVGIFNLSSVFGEKKERDFGLNIINQAHLIAFTADNDFHNAPEKIKKKIDIKRLLSEYNHTFIYSPSFNKDQLIDSIKKGKTYASAFGMEIENGNFQIGQDHPKVQKIYFRFSLKLPLAMASAPKVTVFRNGQEIDEIEKINSPLARQPNYQFEDKGLKPGRYWYILYVPDQLITSPITVNVTSSNNDPIDIPWDKKNWHKGIIHCHSDYSDGRTSLLDIWQQKGANEFIFMTDHSDQFDEASYYSYVAECKQISPMLIPGFEYSLAGGDLRHLLVLGFYDKLPDKNKNEEEFFGSIPPEDKLQILKGPFHLGDDVRDSEIEKDTTFDYTNQDAILKLRVKGSPRKDPIIWINRQEIGRVVTSDDKWHWYEFPVRSDYLRQGKNLFHIESYIPDRWQTFDDCEVADVYILKK